MSDSSGMMRTLLDVTTIYEIMNHNTLSFTEDWGQRPFGSFSKIHPNLVIRASLSGACIVVLLTLQVCC